MSPMLFRTTSYSTTFFGNSFDCIEKKVSKILFFRKVDKYTKSYEICTDTKTFDTYFYEEKNSLLHGFHERNWIEHSKKKFALFIQSTWGKVGTKCFYVRQFFNACKIQKFARCHFTKNYGVLMTSFFPFQIYFVIKLSKLSSHEKYCLSRY